MKVNVLGVNFDSVSMDEALSAALEAMEGGAGHEYIVTPNPEMVIAAVNDRTFADILNGAFLTLPDGIGIVRGAKLLRRPVAERIPGIDFISALLERMDGKRLFLLGSKPGIGERAARNIEKKYPGVVIAGVNDGYFTDDEGLIDRINSAAPDLLLVCLGSPKQEKWMARNALRLNVKLMAGCGGTLDVYAGAVKRAPRLWRRLGLEWLYRLITQPRRIGRMMKLPKFMVMCVAERLRDGKNG